MYKKRLIAGITMGDPGGIGPEVILKALTDKSIQGLADFLIIGNSLVFKETARMAKIKLALRPYPLSMASAQDSLKIGEVKNASQITHAKQGITLLNIGAAPNLIFGKSIPAYGALAWECINEALRLISSKKIDLLITAPVNKHNITQAGYRFVGHTEYLAQVTKAKRIAMMFTAGWLKVTLVTRHVALKEVPRVLTKEKIYQTICLTEAALRKYFAIHRARIAVCGLNPHSGEEGMLGEEEIEMIQPAVIKARKSTSLPIEGPLPADSLFYLALQGKFDAVIAMYHDQGLIPFKMLAMHEGVNLTLGLPFVRTSPDHGTAYNIAGKNQANPGSMMQAIKLAVKIGETLRKR